MEIGEKTIKTINDSICFMVENYQRQINEAWKMAGEDPLTISIRVKLEVNDLGNNEVTTNFSFVKERVKDQSTKSVNENQGELFDAKIG